ncbi:hypothetical protein [Parafrankia discariae]|uniref:hypothetical protein n=1 Tax=Parafrankia discariae TaxID=365528 RepID=UPI00036377DA|nr:hypothetical protein [Parafrankia discariae]
MSTQKAIEAALTADARDRVDGDSDAADTADRSIITQWVAISAWTGMEDGQETAALLLHTPPGGLSNWQLRGLLTEALAIFADGGGCTCQT